MYVQTIETWSCNCVPFRSNLDPHESKSDDDLWQALEIAQLKSVVIESPCGLGKILKTTFCLSNNEGCHNNVYFIVYNIPFIV